MKKQMDDSWSRAVHAGGSIWLTRKPRERCKSPFPSNSPSTTRFCQPASTCQRISHKQHPRSLIRGGKDQPPSSRRDCHLPGRSAGFGQRVFHRYGTSYFLTNIWWGGGSSLGVDVPESKTERELARPQACAGPDQVVLLASR